MSRAQAGTGSVSFGVNGPNNVEIQAATPARAGVMTAAQAAALGSGTFVSGIVTEGMGGLPAGLALPGAVVGMRVIQALGQNGSTKVLENQASDFESVITQADEIQQIAGPSGTGTVAILLFG